MKKIIYLWLILLLICSCKKTIVNEYAIVQGIVENPQGDTLKIMSPDRNIISTITLSENNEFIDTIQKPDGYYYLSCGRRFAQLYLQPNSQIELSFDGKLVDEPITFKGNLGNENNYLAQKALFKQKLRSTINPGYYLKLDEQPFVKLTDSVFQLRTEFFEKFPDLDKDFAYLEKQVISLEIATMLNEFLFMSKQNPNISISNDYPDPYKNIPFNDERLLKIPNFIYFAESYYQDKSNKKQKENKDLDFFILVLETIEKDVENKKIREELAFNTAHNRMIFSQNKDGFYQKYMNMATNEEYRRKVTNKYELFKKIDKGQMSPPFEFFNIDDELVSLQDLKGKPVYIDLWATWCAPCIAEIPKLQELEKRFEKIQFVSICVNDTKEKWEKMIMEKELSGIQLFAPNNDISFFKDYMVEGIPRFILLDKNGKIVDSNAKRPSHPELIEELESLLENEI